MFFTRNRRYRLHSSKEMLSLISVQSHIDWFTGQRLLEGRKAQDSAPGFDAVAAMYIDNYICKPIDL